MLKHEDEKPLCGGSQVFAVIFCTDCPAGTGLCSMAGWLRFNPGTSDTGPASEGDGS